jgi:hypothetical protein
MQTINNTIQVKIMQEQNEIPDFLQDLYQALRCMFPSGIPEDKYWAVVAVLHSFMSFWNIAIILPALTEKHYSEAYLDASGFGLDPMPEETLVEEIRQGLSACVYTVPSL